VTGGCSGATLRKTGAKSAISFNGAGGCEFADGPDTRVAEDDFAVFVVAEPTTSASAGRYDTLLSKADDNRGFLLASPFLPTSSTPAVAGVELAFETKYVARTVPLDSTTHVFVASRIGTKLTFAVDGAAAGTNGAAGGNDDVATALVVGNTPSRGQHELNGRVQEVILLRAPTEAEIASLGACLLQAFRP
jgi:hypothetical protein